METLQITLAAARVNAGMTQEEVAKTMRVGKQKLVDWENNRKELKPAELMFLANLYGISVDHIFLPSN